MDEYAKKIAEDKFKNISLKLIENPYIENLKKYYKLHEIKFKLKDRKIYFMYASL